MFIIGVDYHPSMQQIAWMHTKTGECGERRLMHRAEAEQFYRQLKAKEIRVGIGGHRALTLVRALVGGAQG